jgi:hypothetical protein
MHDGRLMLRKDWSICIFLDLLVACFSILLLDITFPNYRLSCLVYRCPLYCHYRSILHDPDMYPYPLAFHPESSVPDKDGKVARDPAITGAFGYGRRSATHFDPYT